MRCHARGLKAKYLMTCAIVASMKIMRGESHQNQRVIKSITTNHRIGGGLWEHYFILSNLRIKFSSKILNVLYEKKSADTGINYKDSSEVQEPDNCTHLTCVKLLSPHSILQNSKRYQKFAIFTQQIAPPRSNLHLNGLPVVIEKLLEGNKKREILLQK